MTAINADAVTVIKSISPKVLCKRYTKRDGKLIKEAVAHVTKGVCKTWPAADAKSMAKLLARVTQSTELCIVPGVWDGAAGADPFDLVTEGELCELTGGLLGEVAGGVHVIGERRIAARIKRGIKPSAWLLIDADNPPGIPDEWATMSLAERLVFMEPLLPGVSTCERIELRGSSARVVNGSGAGQRTHAWLRVSHPELIETMKARVGVEMVNTGLAFPSPRYSRNAPGTVIGHEQRTVVDLSVWTTGRIVFNARPELGAGMDDYTVADAGIVIANEDAGELDLSREAMPSAPALRAYKARTGVDLSVKVEGGQPRIVSAGQLTMATEIESKGTTKTLAQWIGSMKPGDKQRCEAPFRASQSEAAMIRIGDDGRPIVHDVGNGTTYRLAEAAGATAAPTIDRAEAIKCARALLAPALKDHEAPPYPVAALGPLSAACEAIATAGQVQAAMAGQCLLGAASLLTQGLFNVETLNGRRPLSLYLLTLGDSGDGKSTAQGAALGPVNEWQRKQAKAYAEDLRDFESAKAKRKKSEEPPEAPACPYRLVGDATVEGLRRDLDTGVCSQGVFTDEAAAILSGYGMSADHRSKTAGVFSKLWDNGHLSVSRVTGGRVERYGRRIALHWLIQPMAASESIGDPLLAALGFWPRFLAAWPAPQEPRRAQAFRPESVPAVAAYWARCDALLAMTLPDDAGDCPTLALSEDARAVLEQAFERFEQDARRGGLRPVRPFALRASEQACRLAGVLTAFQGRGEVSGDAMRGALALVAYSLKTWHAVIDQGAADPSAAHALRLYEWLTERPGWCESPAVIVNGGPTCVRTKDKRDAALAVLEAAGLVAMLAGKAHALTPNAEGATA